MGALAAGESFLTRRGGLWERGAGAEVEVEAGFGEVGSVMVLTRLARGEFGREGGR